MITTTSATTDKIEDIKNSYGTKAYVSYSELDIFKKAQRERNIHGNLPVLNTVFLITASAGAIGSLALLQLPAFAICSTCLLLGSRFEQIFHQRKIGEIENKINGWRENNLRYWTLSIDELWIEPKTLQSALRLLSEIEGFLRGNRSFFGYKFFGLTHQKLLSMKEKITKAIPQKDFTSEEKGQMVEDLKADFESLQQLILKEFNYLKQSFGLRPLNQKIQGIWSKVEVFITNIQLTAGSKAFYISFTGAAFCVQALFISACVFNLPAIFGFATGVPAYWWLFSGIHLKTAREDAMERLANEHYQISQWISGLHLETPSYPPLEKISPNWTEIRKLLSLESKNGETIQQLKLEFDARLREIEELRERLGTQPIY
jgi:hypothetical protein